MLDSSPETLVPLPPVVVPLTRVRGTLIAASIGMVRQVGHFERYERALPGAHRAEVLEAIAGTWVSVDAALAHYAACDTLALSESELLQIGRGVSESLRGTLIGSLLRLSKQGGVTPWTFLTTLPRFWGRIFEGSALEIAKLGPKEARFDAHKMPLLGSRYFRVAFRAQGMVALDLFCTKSYIVERAPGTKDGTYSFRAQWA